MGGVYPTFAPEEALANDIIDAICIGEGEQAFLEYCQKFQKNENLSEIKNIWTKKNGNIIKNELREPIDLNSLPYEDYSVFEEKRIYRPMQGKIRRMVPICMDRGCPYNCSFCAAPSQRGLYKTYCFNYFRVKSVDRVIDELKFQIEENKADYIYFNSETFFARKDSYLEEFARAYAKEIALPFWCQTRIETVTEKRIKLLEKMKCDRMSIGLEHGNQKFRETLLNKFFTNEQAIKGFQIIEKSTIPVSVNNIIGFPDETRELVFDTIALNRQITADSINAFFFVPYHGTPLREYAIKQGYLDPKEKPDSLMRSSILQMPQFQPDEIKGLVRTFPLYVKMPKSYYKKIKIAEQLNEEGDAMLNELRDIYFKQYFTKTTPEVETPCTTSV
jgi:radical SAM superfamily enzyme YgiQ (UPF0313 family)